MAVTTKIPEAQLFDYFDRFTKRFLRDDSPEYASVEVLSPDWGEQYESEGEALIGITYDHKKKSLEFALEEQDGFVSSIEVVPQDGPREIVTVKRAVERRK